MELNPVTLVHFGLNILVLVVSGLVGLLVAILRESIKTLRQQYSELETDIRDHKLHVARNHVQRPEFDQLGSKIFLKLDEMRREQKADLTELARKLDSKVDK